MNRQNGITLIGNLVEDPELRFTQSGTAMAKIRIAVTRRWMKDGEWQEEADFFGGTVWGQLAENAAESLKKGHRVILSGSLAQNQWTDKDGNNRTTYEVKIAEVGASLNYATAAITRTPRTEHGDAATDRPAPPPVARTDYGPNEAPF